MSAGCAEWRFGRLRARVTDLKGTKWVWNEKDKEGEIWLMTGYGENFMGGSRGVGEAEL